MRSRTLLAAAAVAGLCVSQAGPASAQALSLKGSDTMLALAQGWAAAYMKARPGRSVSVTGGGSTTGIASLVNGGCDVANASRVMKGSELEKAKARGFVPREFAVARDGLAIVVNPANPVARITMDQLKKIYNGTYTNWKQLGCRDQAIVTVGRDSSSGTYGFFQDTVLGVGRPYRPDMQTTPSTNSIAQTISQDVGAIGYVGVAYAKEFGAKVKIIPVAGGAGEAVMPSLETVRTGKYPLSRYLFMYTRGNPSGTAKDFIDWVRSAQGQSVVTQVGYFPL
jgi:phosphate transport system substrate-binding protein